MSARRNPLQFVTALMAVLAVGFGAALLVDPRTIDGAPAWLKPAKFAVSTAIYSATLAWVLTHLPGWPRLRRVAAVTTAAVFVIEVALIALQAGRGTYSHFNASTVLDGAIFSIMGTGIVVQTLAALAVTVALWRETFADRARGWALRLGMTIAILGASVGGLMTRPTAAQLAAARDTGTMPRVGAHTVGAPDGGPGLPGTGWSLEHGDLRVPHFIGLHAMQVLPFIVLVAARRVRDRARARIAVGAGLSYAALFGILLVQALLGQSVALPAGAIAAALGVWAAGTLAFALAAWRSQGPATTRRAALEIA
jgi:hypothetical protein